MKVAALIIGKNLYFILINWLNNSSEPTVPRQPFYLIFADFVYVKEATILNILSFRVGQNIRRQILNWVLR